MEGEASSCGSKAAVLLSEFRRDISKINAATIPTFLTEFLYTTRKYEINNTKPSSD